MTVFSGTISLCADIIKSLSKMILAFIGNEYVMQILSLLLDFAHISLPSWLAWIIFCIGLGVVYSIVSKIEILETDFEYSSYSLFSWFLAICALVIIALLGIYIYFFDSYIGQATFSLSYWLGRTAGIDHKAAFLIAVYAPAVLCVVSCLCLFIPIFEYRRDLGNRIFVTSGIICILLYTWSIIQDKFSFIAGYLLHSVGWQYRHIMTELTYSDVSQAFALENSYLSPIIFRIVFNVIAIFIIAYYAEQATYEVPKTAMEKMAEARRKKNEEKIDNVLKQQSVSVGASDDTDNELFASLTACLIGYVFTTAYYIKVLYKDFADFDPTKVSQFTDADILRISQSESHIHSQYRIRAIIWNAQAFVKVQYQFGSFANYLHNIIAGCGVSNFESDKDLSVVAKRLVKDLHKRGFKSIGQATAALFLKANSGILKMQPCLPSPCLLTEKTIIYNNNL